MCLPMNKQTNQLISFAGSASDFAIYRAEENGKPLQLCPWHMFWSPQCFLSQGYVSVLEAPPVQLADGGLPPWTQSLPPPFHTKVWDAGCVRPRHREPGHRGSTALRVQTRQGGEKRGGREKCEESNWEKARSHLSHSAGHPVSSLGWVIFPQLPRTEIKSVCCFNFCTAA